MNSRLKTVLFGAGIGALVGLTLAWVITDDEHDATGQPRTKAQLSSGDFFQIAMGVLALATQFNTLVKKP